MPSKIERTNYLESIQKSFKTSKAVILVGPRQIGKSHLAKSFAHQNRSKFSQIHFFDLEDPTDFSLLENPKLSLEPLEGLIVIDEVQRRPELFPYLRVKLDSLPRASRILLLGSASRDLIEQSGETLAGRIAYIEVKGLDLAEAKDSQKLFSRGGYPPSFLASSQSNSYEWRKNYLQSFIERDLRLMGIELPAATLRRFMEMLCAYHGGIFNASEIGKSLGISHTTIRKYVDILSSSFIVRQLLPWHENIKQRQVKSPKIFFRDHGLFFNLMGLKTKNEIHRNPKIGGIWEGFALEETLKHFQIEEHDAYFWSMHQGAELDLLWINKGKKIGFEFKYSDKPSISPSMKTAIDILQLTHLYVIHPGEKSSPIDKKIELLSINQFA